MDSRELSEWIAYDRHEPIPEPWKQTGILAALLSNGLFAGGKRARPEDFIPAERRPAAAQSPAEGIARLQAIAAAMAANKGQ